MEPKNLKSSNNRTKNIIFAVIVILLLGVLFMYGGNTNNPEKIELNQLEQLIQENKVASVYTQENNEIGKILLKESEIKEEDFPGKADYWFVYNENSNDILNENRTNFDFNWINDVEAVDTLSYLMPLLYVGLAIVSIILIFKMINRSNNKTMSFGKNKARVNENVTVKFSDVAGIDEEKEELKEIVDFLKNPKKFSNLGARIPKGVLLVGLPGTGKTLLAKAIAGESNVPFFSISGSDFVEMFVGVGASRVRDLFEQAKRNMPCIVFIDEIDAVGRQRGAGLGGGNDEREQTLNQLLVQMDGFEANEGIIVIAATNRADVLDPALTRPGRFDRQIYVYPPDVKGREEIIAVHAKGKPLADDVDFKAVARLTSGFTGADIESLLNEAALLCAKENRLKITMRDITESVNKVMMGAQKKSRIVTAKDREITAYHEAGHAIVGKSLPNCDTVQEVSIIPRGMAAGYTLSRDDDDNMHMSRNKLNDMLAMMMGGRISEEIAIGDITTGAQNDIQKATSIARRMVVEWGMTERLGFMGFDTSNDVFVGRDYTKQMVYSEELASEIDKEIKVILDTNYARAKEILNSKRSVLDEMVKVLLEKETIYASEVDMLFEGKTAEEVFEIMNQKEIEVKKSKNIEMFKSELEQNKQKLESKTNGASYMQKVGMLSDVEKRNLIGMVEKQCSEERSAIIAKYAELGLTLADIEGTEQKTVEEVNEGAENQAVNNDLTVNSEMTNQQIDEENIEVVVNENVDSQQESVDEETNSETKTDKAEEKIEETQTEEVDENAGKKNLLSKMKKNDKK